MPKIKNIIIFLTIGAVLVFVYFYFIKGSSTDNDTLISSSATTGGTTASPNTDASLKEENSAVAQEFLTLLLSVKSIKLDDAILSNKAFTGLHDSSITLTPDGNEGRINPFAPLGNDVIAPTCVLPQVLDTLKNVCVNSLPN